MLPHLISDGHFLMVHFRVGVGDVWILRLAMVAPRDNVSDAGDIHVEFLVQLCLDPVYVQSLKTSDVLFFQFL